MKRVIIGGFFFLGGLFTTLTIITLAAKFIPSITTWSGKSQLWFAIFGARQFNEYTGQSLYLGFPFIIGVLLTGVGVTILAREYFYNSRDKNN
ncbi:hypothetical protein CN514_24930 [Bacillus sp. AFS001701]|uniref:hypothetical protein n=1 Tax=Bacillus sp. AFS001701 TaxID=2033480 RepID=UPI000BF3E756|nr:hypothetical protein [Bacillus sp. AFS001701]PET35963.1 hypothetical protein CN514_24930 [Bacillus sp. AFS001701]